MHSPIKYWRYFNMFKITDECLSCGTCAANCPAEAIAEGDGKYEIDSLGCIAREFKGSDDKRDYKDGDFNSLIDTDYPLDTVGVENLSELKTDPTDILAPRITKKTRVYKGGSWKDRIYWLNPTTRRFLDQDRCSSTIGFRCAMSTLGNQIDNGMAPAGEKNKKYKTY